MSFCFFHGSPGLVNDIRHVTQHISSFSATSQLTNTQTQTDYNHDIWIAYSWGCRRALDYLAKTVHHPKKIIFISPFLCKQNDSILAKMIVSLPLVGDTILTKKKDSIIHDLAIQSSFPSQPPENYLHDLKKLNLSDIRKAVQEKTKTPPKVDLLAGIQTLVIFGTKDRTSLFTEQIEPLTNYANLKPIEDGGHALIWTHSTQVAQMIEEFL